MPQFTITIKHAGAADDVAVFEVGPDGAELSSHDGDMGDILECLALGLQAAVSGNEKYVRPSVIADAFAAYVEASSAIAFIDNWEEAHSPAEGFHPHVLGHLLLQYLGPWVDAGTSRTMKEHALDISEVLGADHAQTLYRLAVLVTKLA